MFSHTMMLSGDASASSNRRATPAAINGAMCGSTDTPTAVLARSALACRQARIDYFPIDTSMPFDKALYAFLAKRERLY